MASSVIMVTVSLMIEVSRTSGSTQMILMPGFCIFRYFPTPETVPPVPEPATNMSTLPAVSFQILGPVFVNTSQVLPSMEEEDGFSREGIPLLPTSSLSMAAASWILFTEGEAEIEEYNSGRKKWPCMFYPPYCCKCGILARKGVVPSELAKCWFCGNSYGDFWEGSACDWEYFSDQEEWKDEMRRNVEEPWRSRAIETRKNKVRLDHGVLVPRRQDLKKLTADMRRDIGPPLALYTNSQRLAYWGGIVRGIHPGFLRNELEVKTMIKTPLLRRQGGWRHWRSGATGTGAALRRHPTGENSRLELND
ncbi:hypothetical protein U9M48_036727 [Paspalum notatum var. saurae]|uniref:Uncharacterized protein n=1 Tax=Paspalum notatum var. saurae TaxID=547442 RepID=A0AAQ3UF07_PASNO